MDVSIVILNWNGGASDCIESVESAYEQDYDKKEIIFVDNDSSDGSYEAVKEVYPSLKFIKLDENIGCPRGRNVGADNATGELVFFLENDGVWSDKTLVSSAVELFSRYEKLGALYTKVQDYNSDDVDPPRDNSLCEDDDELYLSSTFRGGASVIRREVFHSCGSFPDDFFRQGEERHLSLLIYASGYRVAYWPKYSMRHKGSDYAGKSSAVLKYSIENSLKTIIRLYPVLPALLFGIPKWFLGLARLARRGMFPDAILLNKLVFDEVSKRQGDAVIQEKILCEVELLRQGSTSAIYHEGCMDSRSLFSLVFNRMVKVNKR